LTSPSGDSNTIFIPVTDSLPDEWEEGRKSIIDHSRQMAEGINDRDYGGYFTKEGFAGQNFVPTNTTTRQRAVYRKVIDFSPLIDFSAGAPATKSVAHGISIDANTHFTRIYGTATDPSTAYIPLPFLDVGTLANGIQLDVDATNVNLTSSLDYSGYTTAFVVLEYIREA
jgi:hypothetical protein